MKKRKEEGMTFSKKTNNILIIKILFFLMIIFLFAKSSSSMNEITPSWCSSCDCDSDIGTCYFGCGLGSNWGIGGEIASTTCCGDDIDPFGVEEYYRTTEGVLGKTGDWLACCDDNSDCVYNNFCYSANNYLITSEGYSVKCSSSGGWVEGDCDYNQQTCVNLCGRKWVNSICCGDDTGEYYNYRKGITSDSSDIGCCNANTQCVYAGSCYSDGIKINSAVGWIQCSSESWIESCTQLTCSGLGKSCGSWSDGCGGSLSCGTCASGQTCSNGQCVCIASCSSKQCGDDGCGGSCGTCASGYICSSNQCVSSCTNECSPVNSKACSGTTASKLCGNYDTDPCLEWSSATNCASGQVCNAANGQCECSPKTCAQLGKSCGTWSNGCGGSRNCGTCPSGQVCSAVGQCAATCTAQTCSDLGAQCGTLSDGCGGSLSCGTCASGQVCNADGQCECSPQTCTQLGKSCGTWSDECSSSLNCGSCFTGQTCSADGQCIECDSSQTNCVGGCGLPWSIGGDSGGRNACCGDDASEYTNYVAGRHSGNYYDVAWSDDATIDACCDSYSDCINKTGSCVSMYGSSTGFNPSGNDNIAVCEWGPTGADGPRWWFDCDYNSVACSDCGLIWSKGGEGSVFGEYETGASTLECCGDDVNEYFKRRTGYGAIDGDDACCNSNTDCVYSWACYSDGSVRQLNENTAIRCSSGDWANYVSITNANWTNLNNVRITNTQLYDSVVLAVQGYGLYGRAINFSIYKDVFFWADTKVSQFDSSGSITWQASEPGTFYFKARVEETGQELRSENLIVSSAEDNSQPFAVISKPQDGDSFQINTEVDFEQSSHDEDDDLNVTWDFGDGTLQTLPNCLTGADCNISHIYLSGGAKNVILTATDSRGRTASSWISIDIFQSGIINVFSHISEPEPNEIIQGAGWVRFNASESYAADCTSPCVGDCYQIGSLQCRNLDKNSLAFNWTFDDGESRYGTWQGNYSYAVEFNKFFAGAGVHSATLRTGYS